ncbi:Signal transduction histidine kinase [Lysobacter spongiicola DSM 21749]|uniref:histidine kinase n=1 Tax=Lysobacter spongiicola DSM 21749 TaxID=1122188 RepID=A0A1T4MCM5_9GAMM|nr:Signal transduction histidine kinase [Lysobacter spongiicola DSM 21749]
MNPAGVDAPVKILLVDDQPGRLLTYRAILEPLGEELVEADSGDEALRLLMQDDFALILLDVNMPGMDGFETASMIHQHPRFEKTPIIFVTAVNVTDMDRLRGYKLGAVDYVMVPVIPEILRSKVVVLAELHRKRTELQAANAQLEAANRALQAEQARELEVLNESLRRANAALGAQNVELHGEVLERTRVEQLLREVDRRKDEFLATLAHELRNPLAPLQNALSIRRLAMAGADSEDPLQGLMERQVAQLVRLIDDLLDIARISQAKLMLRRHPTVLQDIVQSAVETARPTVEAGEHELVVEVPESPVHLVADEARLSQVLSNLLNNAAKYSEPGGHIHLLARVAEERVELEVRDAGIGLTPEETERIFEMFSQVNTAVDRTHGGLGIGLTLVRRLVEMHGGEVSVQSDGPGQGSTFKVSFPHVCEPTGPESTEPAGAVERSASGGKRVVVADDNRDAADTLAMMIEMLGHDVHRHYTPHTVIADVREFRPDIVFLDVGMPGMSGYELARTLRAQPECRNMAIVAVTGWGQPDDRRLTREAGFDEHLVKPPALDAIARLCSGPDRARHDEEPTDA